jgi:hypothetical protein
LFDTRQNARWSPKAVILRMRRICKYSGVELKDPAFGRMTIVDKRRRKLPAGVKKTTNS